MTSFLQVINNPIIYKFFKDFSNHRKKTNWAIVFQMKTFLTTFLNTGTTYETFQHTGQQDTFRNLLKSSASMYQISGSKFFRTTTEIQSEPDAFDESSFVMTFLTIFGVMEILCSFRQFQKWKQLKRYLTDQGQSFQKSIEQTILLYQMQKTTSEGH